VKGLCPRLIIIQKSISKGDIKREMSAAVINKELGERFQQLEDTGTFKIHSYH
jgi:hypothetical protein